MKRRKALARVLRKNGLPASEASVSEWGDLMTGLGGCASPEAVYEGIAWIVARAHRDGNSVSYAREAASLATQWAKRQGAPA